jgi:hypothetical protein
VDYLNAVKRFVFFFCAAWALVARAAPLPAKISFNRDIRPILSENCYHCHGPDKKTRDGGRRLDLRADALADLDGIRAFVPGKPEESDAIIRIFSDDKDEQMPPLKAHKTLTAQQKELLKRWVADGAVYEAHWAYIAPRRPALPEIATAAGPVRHPIDALVFGRLAEAGLTPSPPADARTLIRRLSLDLTGLPPTAKELHAFLDAASRDPQAAVNQAVDRLLASPRYGERMAVPWLDAVRFADTVGYHGDQNVNIFPYRDYVIDAFNANKPFDQFTIEQIAGDLLPNPTPEQRVATGFNRLNLMTREGGAQPREYLAKYHADRVRVISSAWLGATFGCAECHDHKFDPISQKDFYSLAAFFADIRQWGVYTDYSYTPNPDLPGFTNDHPFPPELEVNSPALLRRIKRYEEQLERLAQAAAQAAPKELASWREQTRALLDDAADGWRTLHPTVTVGAAPPKKAVPKKAAAPKIAEAEQTGSPEAVAQAVSAEREAAPAPKAASAGFTIEENGRVVFSSKLTGTPSIKAATEGPIAAIRMELLPDAKHREQILRANAKSATLKPQFSVVRRDSKRPEPLSFRLADAEVKEARYSNGFEIRGVKDAWKIGARTEPATAVWLLETPIILEPGDKLLVKLEGNLPGCVRISVSPLATVLPLADRVAFAKDGGLTSELTWLFSTGGADTFAEAKELCAKIAECRGGRAKTLVTETVKEPFTIRVLPRGDWQNESGEIVQPVAPHALPQIPNPDGRRLSRLDLARWLVAPEHPLTARVFMNRLWKQFFGNALSAVVDDFGAQGEWPTHPELLDWLAVEFRESGWNVKEMVKLIVTSAAWQQSANLRLELREADPHNRLLASQNPRRLDAEFVRDNALFLAGLLSEEYGGPSAKPYQPAGYYDALQFPDRTYTADQDDRQYRRGVYTHWQRTFLHPMLANFDAPSREESACTRTVANTPQQALTLLNDPSFVEAARAFAGKLLATAANDDAHRIAHAFEHALARMPHPRELRSLTAFLARQREHYRSQPEDAEKLIAVGQAPVPAAVDRAELAAWTSLARVILNLHEVITRY